MWVRTPTNDLCNLSHARRVTCEGVKVLAWFSGESEPTVIAEYETAAEAQQFREGIAGEIGARKFKLRAREESKS